MKWQGEVAEIYVASGAGEPMQAQFEVMAIAGRGLEGGRYTLGSGFYSWFAGPLCEVSLIEDVSRQPADGSKSSSSTALSSRKGRGQAES